MDQRQRLAHGGIAQTREPTGLLVRQRRDVAPHPFNEHQFAELRQHALASGALIGDFGDRELDELAKPAGVVAARVPRLQHRRQGFEQWFEWTGAPREIAAYEFAGTLPAAGEI